MEDLNREDIIRNEREIFSTSRDIAPFEHIALGSSLDLDGEFFNGAAFIEFVKNKDLKDSIFRVPAVEVGESIDDINRRRQSAKLIGPQGLFEYDERVAGMQLENILTRFKLNDIGENGQVEKNWRVRLTNELGEDIVREEILKSLELRRDFQPYFKQEISEDGSEMVVSLKEEYAEEHNEEGVSEELNEESGAEENPNI